MSNYTDEPDFCLEISPGLTLGGFFGPGQGPDHPHVIITEGRHHIIVTLDDIPALIKSLAAAAWQLRQEPGMG